MKDFNKIETHILNLTTVKKTQNKYGRQQPTTTMEFQAPDF